MIDLVAGFVWLVGMDVLLFAAGAWVGRTRSIRVAQALGLAAMGLTFVLWFELKDSLRLAELIPVSNLIVVGHGEPLLAGFLTGLAWSLIPRQQGDRPGWVAPRRWAVVLSLQAAAWYAVVEPIWGSPPACRDAWEYDLCLQTTEDSCSAACAATLLRAHGIGATEAEMARLCLTRKGGTLWLGLYRGLKLKTAGTDWEVAVIPPDFTVLTHAKVRPSILAAGLPHDARMASVYTERYGWSPGKWHSVIFFGMKQPERAVMGDPTPGIGREEWSAYDLKVLWQGTGLYLRPR